MIQTMTSTTILMMSKNNQLAALVIVAAGSSTRMGGSIKKEYLPLNGGTVLSQTAAVFLRTGLFSVAVIAHPADGEAQAKEALFALPEMLELSRHTSILFTPGGTSRAASVRCALKAIDVWKKNESDSSLPDVVLIHDGARPFVSARLVSETVRAAREFGAAAPGLQPVETQKELDKQNNIIRHLKRSSLCSIQTPQGFDFSRILSAHDKASELTDIEFTDDTEIWDRYYSPKTHIIEGENTNIKITYPKDLNIEPEERKMIRTGLGYDLHPLVEGRKLILGGIEIPFNKGEKGHSDGDVLLHAITDALLGASALGDIGSYFPPEDPQWKDADSAMLLQTVWHDIKAAGFNLENLDCVVCLEQPKFLPYRNEVRKSIAEILGVNIDQIFVKAKTGEKLGKIGHGEAVEVFATCLLSK